MSDDRLPKQLLFGELQKAWPFHGTKKYVVLSDLKAINVDNCWYSPCQNIGCIGIKYVTLQFGKWRIPEDRTAVLLTFPPTRGIFQLFMWLTISLPG